jgi:hypothetical protein
MDCLMKRSVLFAALAAVSCVASAENYQAVIYAPPAGFTSMTVLGGAENGLVSGYGIPNGELPDTNFYHALYMTPQGVKDMHPAGFDHSVISESWGATYHCGSATSEALGNRAFFWIGGGAGVNLHPAGAEYTGSSASGGGGQQQVGVVEGSFFCVQCNHDTQSFHAGMWSRTAASFSRLHATNHETTRAVATDGQRQAGGGLNMSTGFSNALLWNGPNSMAVNLHPQFYEESYLNTIQGSTQGGYVRFTGQNQKAALWTSTAASMVVIHPAGFNSSKVNFLRNGLQVGEGIPTNPGNRIQAIAWHGTAGSWINLHSKLPAAFLYWSSAATGIDSVGNIRGYITNPGETISRAVIWKRI